MSSLRNALGTLSVLVLLALSSSAANGQSPQDSSHPAVGDNFDYTPESLLTRTKLNSIVIPSVDFKDVDIYAVIDFLNRKSKEFDPKKTGVQFSLELGAGPVTRLSGPEWNVVVNLNDASLEKVLDEVCADDTPIEWSIIKGTVVLYLGAFPPSTDPPLEITARKNVARSLRRIIIPSVKFQKEDVTDVVNFLSEQSRRFDPKHVGVKMELQLPANSPPGRFPFHRAVSLTLENDSLEDILGLMLNQTNLEYTINPDGIIVKPMDLGN